MYLIEQNFIKIIKMLKLISYQYQTLLLKKEIHYIKSSITWCVI